MLTIGLTGGIGSGKSTVARIFEVLGIPVYYADAEAKRLMNEDPILRQSVIDAFGPLSYADGLLDRKYISEIVFNNKERLNQLNLIVHPATIRDAESWIAQQNSHYIIKEAALLFESGANKHLDKVIGVSSPESLRIERTIKRDGLTYDEVLVRMKKQMNEEEKLRLCDYVIYNDEVQPVISQVLELNKLFLKA